jgi:hypothetical protein
MSATSSALKFVGTAVANGALGKVGGDLMGFVLGSIFGDSSNKEVMEALQQIGEQLKQIEYALRQISAEMRQGFADIKQELTKLHMDNLYLEWQDKDVGVQAAITQIATQYGRYTEYAQNGSTTSREQVDELVKEILNTNNGAEPSMQQINGLVLSVGMSKGALRLWQDMVSPLVSNGVITYGQAISAYLDYYGHILFAQARAAALLVEAYNKKADSKNAKATHTNYRRILQGQEPEFLNNMEPLYFAATTQGSTWSGRNVGFDYFMVWQAITAQGIYASSYRPTLERQAAEDLLGSAYALLPNERRIVVLMVVPYGNEEFKNSVLSLIAGNETTNPITPDSMSNATLAARINDQDHQWLLRRFVYTKKINDGTYHIDPSINDKYPPRSGSGGRTWYFLDPAYADYTLSVDPGSPSDFLDFCPYATMEKWAAVRLGVASAVTGN